MVTRNEGVRLRPFQGVDLIQKAFDGQSILAIKNESKTEDFFSHTPIEIYPKLISSTGLTWKLSGDLKELMSAIQEAKVEIDQVSLVVKCSDRNVGILRESEVLQIVGLQEFSGAIEITVFGQPRPSRILENLWTGFKVDTYLVLNSELPKSHLHPWMRGTILARDTFELIPVAEWDSIQPIELTPELRKALGLKPEVWFHTVFTDDFFESQEMSEAIVFYVDRDILAGIKGLPEHLSLPAQAMLAGALLPQIVFKASLELERVEGEYDWDGTTGVLLRFLHRSFDSKTQPADFIRKLIDQPETVCSFILGRNGLGPKLSETFKQIAEGGLDVSNINNFSS
jgi:hypothetical protein